MTVHGFLHTWRNVTRLCLFKKGERGLVRREDSVEKEIKFLNDNVRDNHGWMLQAALRKKTTNHNGKTLQKYNMVTNRVRECLIRSAFQQISNKANEELLTWLRHGFLKQETGLNSADKQTLQINSIKCSNYKKVASPLIYYEKIHLKQVDIVSRCSKLEQKEYKDTMTYKVAERIHWKLYRKQWL